MVTLNMKKLREITLTSILIIFVLFALAEAIVPLLHYLGLHTGHPSVSHFGRWSLVVFYALLFGFFVLAFAFPQDRKEWRSAGLLQGFIIALYYEMYGFPLTVYVLSSYLGFNLLPSHSSGHVLAVVFTPFVNQVLAEILVMILSNLIIISAALLVYFGWRKVYYSPDKLVTGGLYKFLRHPQYLGFIMITVALLIHWPTILTVLMWPIILFTYIKLAKKEDNFLAQKYPQSFAEYKAQTPAFFPKLG